MISTLKRTIAFFVIILLLGTGYYLMRQPRLLTIEERAQVVRSTENEARILFVGDLFFDRTIRQVIDKKGYDHVFSCVKELLYSADFVVGNLEGPITEHASVSVGSKVGSPNNFVFTFPTTTAAALFKHNIRLVSLGNNHITNFGVEGLRSTHTHLEDAGVNYFGGIKTMEPIYRRSVGGQPVSFISYNEFGGDSPEVVAKKIKVENVNERIVVVYTHWGAEYVPPGARVKEAAKLFAEAGADLIVGSHPHVVLENEQIGKTTVYYSLGNFIFDQYFNAKVREGLAILVTIKDGKIIVKEYPVTMLTDGRTCF